MKKVIQIRIPGTKSLANRALLLAALAQGESCIQNLPEGEDVDLMIKALRGLGVSIKKYKGSAWIKGTGGFFEPVKKKFSVGNAGTVARFLTPLLAIIPQKSLVKGDGSMEKRPIHDLIEGLRRLGAEIRYIKKQGFLPLEIRGKNLTGGKIELDASMSSQYLSGLLMIAPSFQSKTEIWVKSRIASEPYVDMTVTLMKKFAVNIEKKHRKFTIRPARYKGIQYRVEEDCAAASYFAGIAHLHKQPITFNIPQKTNQGEYEFFKAIKKIGTVIDCKRCPDTSMTLATLAAVSKGRTKLMNIGHLAIKETDRLSALYQEIQKLGIRIKKTPDSLIIDGNPNLKITKPILIKTYHDHRMAMSFAVLKSKFPSLEIENPLCVKKSYPHFWKDYQRLLRRIGKNMVLTGMRGSGKSTIGKKLATVLAYRFIDTDEDLEKKFRMSIAAFVKKFGWKKFRAHERLLIKKISQKTHCVVAAGGGLIIDPLNEKLLRKNGWIIYIKCPIAVLIKRLIDDPKHDKRPSLLKRPSVLERLSLPKRPSLLEKNLTLKKHLINELGSLFKIRKKRYEASADIIISCTENDPGKNILEKIFPCSPITT